MFSLNRCTVFQEGREYQNFDHCLANYKCLQYVPQFAPDQFP